MAKEKETQEQRRIRKAREADEKIQKEYGVIGDKLRRSHVGDLVYDLGILIVAARDNRQDRIDAALESIRDTLSDCSDKFERELFIPAVERQIAITIEHNAKHANASSRPRMKTETLEAFVARGGKVQKIATEGTKIINISLEDLGL